MWRRSTRDQSGLAPEHLRQFSVSPAMSDAIAITPAAENCDSSVSFRFEQIQIDRFSHLKIAKRRRMNSIAAIVGNVQEVGIRGAAHDAVEVDDGIKGIPLSNRGIDVIAHFRFGVLPAAIAATCLAVVAERRG